MKIFLTGGTGFLGSKFYDVANSKHDLIFLNRKSTSNPKHVFGTLTSDFPVLKTCNMLIHFASHGVSPCKTTFKKAYEINVKQTLKLLNHAADQGVKKFIIIGSSQEYGELAQKGSKISTSSPLIPKTNYAKSKVKAFYEIKEFCQKRKVFVTYLRVFNTFGEGQKEDSLWGQIKKSINTNNKIKIKYPNKMIDILPAEKAAKKIFKFINFSENKRGKIKVANVGSGKIISIANFTSDKIIKLSR